MKNLPAIILFTFFIPKIFGQSEKYLGINLFQIPASTINSNFSADIKPFFTPVIDIGYTFNYETNLDFIGNLLTPHTKYYDGYKITKQSGGYIKIGGHLNLRGDYGKNNFFHIGLFLTNSLVYEKALYLPPFDSRPYSYASQLEHNVFLTGISTSFGYEFRLLERLKANLDFQFSFPANKYNDLYSYRNFIPGMGFKDTEGNWFPMLILNLKYKIL